MKTMMRLKAASPLMTREWPDSKTGEVKRIHWMELYLSDGVEEMVGELTVRPTQGQDGRLEAKAPELHVGGLYTVQFELSTNVTRKENGTERRFNKLTVVKLAEL